MDAGEGNAHVRARPRAGDDPRPASLTTNADRCTRPSCVLPLTEDGGDHPAARADRVAGHAGRARDPGRLRGRAARGRGARRHRAARPTRPPDGTSRRRPPSLPDRSRRRPSHLGQRPGLPARRRARTWRATASPPARPTSQRCGLGPCSGLHSLGEVAASSATTDVVRGLDEVDEALGPDADAALRAEVLAARSRSRSHLLADDRSEARHMAAHALGWPAAAGHETDPGVLPAGSPRRHLGAGHRGRARLSLATELAEVGRSLHDPAVEAQGLLLTMVAELELGDPTFRQTHRRFDAIAEASRSPRLRFWAASRRGTVARPGRGLRRGDRGDRRGTRARQPHRRSRRGQRLVRPTVAGGPPHRRHRDDRRALRRASRRTTIRTGCCTRRCSRSTPVTSSEPNAWAPEVEAAQQSSGRVGRRDSG